MKDISASLNPLLKEIGLTEDVRLYSLRKIWQHIFSEPLSLHMSPASLREGVLLVNVDSPSWLQQLTFYKSDIIRKLSRTGISDVRFRIGRVPQKKKLPAPGIEIAYELTGADMKYIEEAVSDVKDAELREKIKEAIKKCISHNSNPKNKNTR